MKNIQRPIHDDNALLDDLSNNQQLSSYPALLASRDDILAQYGNFLQNQGNPWVVLPLGITDPLKGRLITHYNQPPTSVTHLEDLRDNLSPAVCLMCGSQKSWSLDHYLPKDIFPELALFSANLVPSCDCNIKRSKAYRGVRADQRPLHPYFDTCLQMRLYRAEISGDLNHPIISLVPCCGPIAEIEAVQFHLNNILIKTNIVNWLSVKWAKLVAEPYVMLCNLPQGNIDIQSLTESIIYTLHKYDQEHDTPNNWYSFLYAGILASTAAVPWLAQKITDINNQHI